MTRPTRGRGSSTWVLVAVIAALISVGGLALFTMDQSRPTAQPNPPPTRVAPSVPTQTQPNAQPSGAAAADPAAYDIQRLSALDPVPAGPTTTPTISGEAAQQPDLYAAEFVRRLLTQDYRTDRTAHLRWVQAESAQTREPLVIGLVPPELRGRYALFSVTDAAHATPPIPTRTEWETLGLQHGYTAVTVDRVEEPFAWTNAVASGRVTDPGATGREVTATLVRHTTVDGQPRTATFSVAIALNLEGPPTRPTWGFVAAVTYTAIQVR